MNNVNCQVLSLMLQLQKQCSPTYKNELIFQNLHWYIKSIDMHGQQDDRNALIILPFTDIKRFVLIT